MKDFDVERADRLLSEDERTFVFFGETFVLVTGVRPETLTKFEAYAGLNDESPVLETMAAIDELFLTMIADSDGAHDRYRSLREREEDPVTIRDLMPVVDWMTDVFLPAEVEAETGRPTGSPTASGGGRKKAGTSSTGDSSSPGLKAA